MWLVVFAEVRLLTKIVIICLKTNTSPQKHSNSSSYLKTKESEFRTPLLFYSATKSPSMSLQVQSLGVAGSMPKMWEIIRWSFRFWNTLSCE